MRTVTAILILTVFLTSSVLFGVKPARASWTSGEWTVEPSQTLVCYHWNVDTGTPKECQAIRVDVLADQFESNAGWDYYQLVLRAYDYNTSSGGTFAVKDYSAYILYDLVNGASGTVSVQPQGGYVFCPQPTFTLAYSFLSVNLLVPCSQIDFWDNIGATQDDSHWHIYSFVGPVFNFYGETGIVVSIPEGQGRTFTFHYRDEGPVYPCIENNGNNCYFDITASITVPSGHVDPPGSGGGCTSNNCALKR